MSPDSDWLSSTPALPERARGRLGRALSVSLVAHAGFAVLLVIMLSVNPTPVDTRPQPIKLNAVYLPIAGPSGGGGGDTAPAAAKVTEVPRHESPKPAPITPTPAKPEVPREPLPVLDVTVETTAAKTLQVAGTAVMSLGPGGLGDRPGGAGPGRGPGVGPGENGRSGGGPRQIGGDVIAPTLLRSVDPVYTAGALAAKLSGTVELEAVVLTNGTVSAVRVTKSLDAAYGLDQEAIKAARQWLFRPGTQQGKPVDVYVKLILEFHIR
jgi:protein TonB